MKASLLLGLALAACGQSRDEQPHVPVPPARPVTWGGPAIDCAALLTADEVHTGCRRRVAGITNAMEGMPWAAGAEHGGNLVRICARQFRFSDETHDMIAVDLNAYESEQLVAQAFPLDPAAARVGTSGMQSSLGNMHFVLGRRGKLVLNVNWVSPKPVCADGGTAIYKLLEQRIDELTKE